ncbi:Ferredoxin-thioredoxin reductase variable chain [Tripterygium wilfordii]|uniref:Ferredoxin-thioredoxin reductase variable chain n=1 Tax=Tripterygium wilfordii TaxID=458696 RepID=A0A7J7DM44_TRIWF|nr:ferredoxin-thioredoxin reductase, variable chain, chloroplastic-like [Tripterygium wilfordii]KAF5747440.1 Ferredoxin-thioredoxin reductase variable chain [Tripterygium wilfordii]
MIMSATAAALASVPSAIKGVNTATSAFDVSSRSSLPFPVVVSLPLHSSLKKPDVARRRSTSRIISRQVALNSSNSTVDHDISPSSSPPPQPEEDEEASRARIGARVRVNGPLKVYHVPKVPEMDLTGMEGNLKQYVGLWKGKRISANLPYKVEFFTEIEGRGRVKFFAHLKEDEFDYID